MLRRFCMKKLQDKDMKLFFLNCSNKNFKLLEESRSKNIIFLVLAVDCIKKDGVYQILLENNESGSESQMEEQKFLQSMQNIRFRYLILFGSLSLYLGRKIV